jgi:phosphatidate cytidylyltransferase
MMLRQRLVTGFVLASVALVSVWYGAPWFTLFIGLAGVVGICEFYHICNLRLNSVLAFFGIVMTSLFIASAHLPGVSRVEVLGIGTILSLIWLLFRRNKERAFRDWAWMIGGAVYIGLLLSFLVLIREFPFGREWVYLVILANIGSDVFAYFLGRSLGKRPLAASISPSKTWAGFFGGLVGTISIGLVCFHFVAFPIGVTYGQAALLCGCIGISAPLGDLVESLLKRNCQRKEAGNLLPGHGGVLDRLDSVLFSGTMGYFYLLWSGLGV